MRTNIGKTLIGIFVLAVCTTLAAAQETLEELNRRIDKLHQDIAELSESIKKDPAHAENYLQRGELYIELSNATDGVGYLPLARGVADFSRYLRLKPKGVDGYHLRAEARFDLFIGPNPFSIRDWEKSVRLVPRDLETKDTLRNARAEYRKTLSSEECGGNRRNYPTTELVRVIEKIRTSAEKQNSDTKHALQLIACGANANYINPKSGEPAFSDLAQLPVPLIVALLEAGADPNWADKNGNTFLLKMLDFVIRNGSEFDGAMLEKVRILIDYGANSNHRNRAGQSVLSLARKTKNERLIKLLVNHGVK